ncbi:MAG: hypothetical protein ABI380_10695, partial [Edaphobacter sp.]
MLSGNLAYHSIVTETGRARCALIGNMAVSVAATVLNEVRDIPGLVSSLIDQTLAPAEVII